ncbi:active regulator of SIRT1-like [Odontomachus brunneus]|uniref:active regulator of SIRT1-like n=1 Tax=Odontomachus brunneus TaxID=486640 RepID=UPI0013F277B6|nr:active regulator of SIRT1-like [Odontomachus brunneus]
MSKSLVHKSLEYDEIDLRPNTDKKKKKKKHPAKDTLYKGVLDLIPARHRFTSEEDKAVLSTILGRSGRVTVYEVQKRLATQKDPTEENVQRLLSLKTNQLKSEMSNKLLQRAVKKKYIKKQEKPKEEATAFTEEDFKMFEQEHIE